MIDDEKDKEETMEAIDAESYRKMFEEEEAESFKPIEVKSTRHLEIQKEQEKKEEIKKDAHSAAKEVFDWIETLVVAMVFIVILFTFIVRVNTVDGDSMNPTLNDGQKLLVTDLFYTPNYNDIVIVQAAKLDGGKPIIKRIIGLPGDKISIDFTKGIVTRNGEELQIESEAGKLYEDGHLINDYTTRNLEMTSGQEYTVPEDCYFVLGDNRNRSSDSRLMSQIGFVEKNFIAGRAVFSIFPFSSFGFAN